MKTKKVKLQNIATEVPENAELLTDPINQLKVGDFVLEVWDNKKFPGNMEINTRMFTQIRSIDQDNDHIIHGGHFGEAKDYNATTCTFGSAYPNRDMKGNYPHIWFFIRHSEYRKPSEFGIPNLVGNPGFDLMM